MISSMVCCIATCAMIPAAPARSAGLVRSDPGPANWTNPLIWPLFPFSTPVLRLVFELFLSPVLAGKLRGLFSQLHPAARVGRNLGTCLCGSSPGTEHSSEPGPSQILRRQPLRGEEAFDCLRIPDDR